MKLDQPKPQTSAVCLTVVICVSYLLGLTLMVVNITIFSQIVER